MNGLPDLFQELAAEAKHYDVTERALTGARRRRRTRMLLPPLLAAAVALAVVVGISLLPQAKSGQPSTSASPTLPAPTSAPPARLPSSCVVQPLTVPDGFRIARMAGGSPTNRLLVGQLDPGGALPRPVMWDGDRPVVLPAQGARSWAADVNDLGAVVGTSDTADGGVAARKAWVWRGGVVTVLKGDWATAGAIGETGVIGGSVHNRPAFWRDPAAEPQLLPMPDGFTGTVTGIDDDGTMIGELSPTPGGPAPNEAMVWRADGTRVQLEGAEKVLDIRNGWVTGVIGEQVWRWNLRTGKREALAAPLSHLSAVVNAHGWVAGQTLDGGLQIVTTDQVLELPLPPNARRFSGSVVGLADGFGAVTAAGNYTPADDLTVEMLPVTWRCS